MASRGGLEVIDSTVQKTYEWLNDLATELGIDDRRRAYQVLRAFLNALRDRLPVDDAVNLGAQLPILVRGIYYEGWEPAHKPMKLDAEGFLAYVAEEAFLGVNDDWRGTVRAAVTTLRRHIDPHEVDKVAQIMPEDVRRLLVIQGD